MILGYLPRLFCVGLAVWFALYVGLAAAARLTTDAVLAHAGRIPAKDAARRLFLLRLAPAGGAVLVAVSICLPSYLWLEPQASLERVGWGCLGAAALGLGLWAMAMARALRALTASWLFMRRCRPAVAGGRRRAWIVETQAPLLAAAGIFRHRLMVSRGLLRALSREQLAAAVRHELGHGRSRDNLKRLCLFATPALPFSGARATEQAWRVYTEWAADDFAAGGSVRRSYALAAALVRVARMGSGEAGAQLVTALLGDRDLLGARVDRLLGVRPVAEVRPGRAGRVRLAVILPAAAGAVGLMMQPAVLRALHRVLEGFIE